MVKNLTKESSCNWDWVDVTDPSAEDLQEVAQKYSLHPALVQDSLNPIIYLNMSLFKIPYLPLSGSSIKKLGFPGIPYRI